MPEIKLYKKEEIIEKLSSDGVSKTDAEITADVMTVADKCGVLTHGSKMLPTYIKKLSENGFNLNPDFKVIRETNSFAVLDGDNSIGFVSAVYSMEYAKRKAKENGMFTVFSRNNNTFGPAFYYPLLAAKSGMIGIISSNSPAQMAPIGGREKMLGTNPFAAAIPIADKDPIIIDMASSIVAKSRFAYYKEQGKKLPDGWALDENGEPTNDPDSAIKGFIMPMAGHKGYAIAMLIDILSGVMSGAAYLDTVGRFYTDSKNGMNVGFMCTVIDPYAVLGEEYDERIKDFEEKLRNTKTIKDNIITLPGDRKHRAFKQNEEKL